MGSTARIRQSSPTAPKNDVALASLYELRFEVLTRLIRPERALHVAAERVGLFDDPTEALEYAFGLVGVHAEILVNGHGPYWHSSRPTEINSDLLAMVCRDLRIGPELANVMREISALESKRSRVEAEMRLADAIEITKECVDNDHAHERLGNAGFTTDQRFHLLTNLRLSGLTQNGTDAVEAEIESLAEAIAEKHQLIEKNN